MRQYEVALTEILEGMAFEGETTWKDFYKNNPDAKNWRGGEQKRKEFNAKLGKMGKSMVGKNPTFTPDTPMSKTLMGGGLSNPPKPPMPAPVAGPAKPAGLYPSPAPAGFNPQPAPAGFFPQPSSSLTGGAGKAGAMAAGKNAPFAPKLGTAGTNKARNPLWQATADANKKKPSGVAKH